jgi:hypothetical protein
MKNCYEKIAVGKVEDRLVRAAMSCGKLYIMGEIHVIPLKVRGTVYIQNTRTNLMCSLFHM